MAIIKNSSQDTFVIVTNFSPFKQSSLLHLDLALFSEESVQKISTKNVAQMCT